MESTEVTRKKIKDADHYSKPTRERARVAAAKTRPKVVKKEGATEQS